MANLQNEVFDLDDYNPVIETKPVSITNDQKLKRKEEFINKNLTSLSIILVTVLLILPFFSHPIKKHFSLVQWIIKMISYSGAVTLSSLALMNENSPTTLKRRRLEDSKLNLEWDAARQTIVHENAISSMDSELKVEQDKIRTLNSYPYLINNGAQDPNLQKEGQQNNPTQNMKANIVNNDYSSYSNHQNQNNPVDQDTLRKSITEIYKKLWTSGEMTSFLVFGNSGDMKTSFLHKFMHTYLTEIDDSAIFWVLDRKYFAGTRKDWKANWCGLPVYETIGPIVQNQFPHPCVYIEQKPDLLNWITPIYNLCVERAKAKDKTKTPLWDAKRNKYRKVIMVIDDGTTVMGDIVVPKGVRKDTVKQDIDYKLNYIGTMGRELEVSAIFTSHSNASGSQEIPSTFLKTLEPLIGCSYVNDIMSNKLSVNNFAQEGVAIANQAIQSESPKGFVTTRERMPYIYPYPFENGISDCIISELACIWHKHAPDGFVDEIDQLDKAFAKHNFDVNNRENSTIDVPGEPMNDEIPHPQPSSESSDNGNDNKNHNEKRTHCILGGIYTNDIPMEIAILEQLRLTYKSELEGFEKNLNPKPDDDKIIKIYVTVSEVDKNSPNFKKSKTRIIEVVKMEDNDFHKALYDE